MKAVYSESPRHRQLRDDILTALGEWRRFLISIDGVDGAGKSTLARYLAWQVGAPAIETDTFLDSQNPGINYRLNDLGLVLQSRLDRNLPVFVEGICVLRTLRFLDLVPDFLIYVEQEGYTGSNRLGAQLADYREGFTPVERANVVFSWRRPELDVQI